MLCELCHIREAVCIMSSDIPDYGARLGLKQQHKTVCDSCSEVYHERNWNRGIMPSHKRIMGKGKRQVCCKVCHECGSRLYGALDGEQYCAVCGAYR